MVTQANNCVYRFDRLYLWFALTNSRNKRRTTVASAAAAAAERKKAIETVNSEQWKANVSQTANPSENFILLVDIVRTQNRLFSLELQSVTGKKAATYKQTNKKNVDVGLYNAIDIERHEVNILKKKKKRNLHVGRKTRKQPTNINETTKNKMMFRVCIWFSSFSVRFQMSVENRWKMNRCMSIDVLQCGYACIFIVWW